MRTSVPGVALPPRTKLAWHETLDSTNEEARRLAREGERGPLWIVAERQTKGRGRQGRAWTSAEGNLTATLLMKPTLRPQRMALLSFVAALAVGEFVQRCGVATQMKWPNDVLASRRKIAGILLESSSTCGEGGDWLAIGIGVNLVHFPKDTPFPATSVAAERGQVPSLPEAVTSLAQRWESWLGLFREEGFTTIRDLWHHGAAGLGESLSVRLPDETVEGVFLGLDADGALRLDLGNGRERLISAGDVFFRDGV